MAGYDFVDFISIAFNPSFKLISLHHQYTQLDW